MQVGDIFSVDVLVGIGLIGLAGGLLSGKNGGTRLFAMLVAWLILMMVWPVAFAVLYVIANIGAGIYSMVAGVEVSAAGRAVLGKGLTFGLMLAIYGKLVWEEMQSPEHRRGACVAGPPKSPLAKNPWR